VKDASTVADVTSLSKGDVFDVESAYVEMLRNKPRDNRQGHFHPSAVGMCGRRNVYEYIRAPAIQTIEPEDLEVFDMGHAVHGMIQDKLESMGAFLQTKGIQYSFRPEVRFDPQTDVLYQDLHVGGTTDGILEVWTDTWRQRGIIEIKSIKDENFKKLRGPKEDHVMQAHIYAKRFDCPVMWIWYFNKDTSERKVYTVLFQKDILQKAVARYAGWLEHADNGTLPEREESFYICPRCEYREVCKPASLAKIRSRLSDPSSSNLRRIVEE
jgi:CRISPR/Cas system-associated exonuclease Cas4 (RecB family)